MEGLLAALLSSQMFPVFDNASSIKTRAIKCELDVDECATEAGRNPRADVCGN